MPTVITPVITDAGLNAAITANGNGVKLSITHVVLSTDQFTPTGTSTISVRKEKATVASGYTTGAGAFRINVLFSSYSGATYNATAIGFYAGDPDAGGTLFAAYSHPTSVIVQRNSLDYLAQFGLTLSRVPSGSVSVTVDPSAAQAFALISAHEQAADPHPNLRNIFAELTKTVVDRSTRVIKTTNWNQITAPGMYQVESDGAFTGDGAPKAGYAYGSLLVTRNVGSAIAQIYISHAGKELWYRGGWISGANDWPRPWTLVSGTAAGEVNAWRKDDSGFERNFYETNNNLQSTTYYKGGGNDPHQWRDDTDRQMMRLAKSGPLVLPFSDLSLEANDRTVATTEWVKKVNAGPTVIDRTGLTAPLLLDRFDVIHKYQANRTNQPNGGAINITTQMVPGGIYKLYLNATNSGSFRNSDIKLRPNGTSYANQFESNQINITDPAVDPKARSVRNGIYGGSATASGSSFYFDIYDGGDGSEAATEMTLFPNQATAYKKVLITAGDTAGITVACGTWISNTVAWATVGALEWADIQQSSTSTYSVDVSIRRIA